MKLKIYVSPQGCDTNPGTESEPLRTAKKAFLTAGKQKAAGAEIIFRKGNYFFDKTAELRCADVKITAYGDEEVHFIGGKELDLSAASLVSDKQILKKIPAASRGKVMQTDLGEQGITGAGITERMTFFGDCSAQYGLIFNGNFMTTARWPKNGYAKIGKVINEGKDSYTFELKDKRIANWKNAKDCLLFGYWKYLWASDVIGVKNINTNKSTITTDNIATFGIEEKRCFYIFNLMEELSAKNEYYIDKDTDMLYFIPPKKITKNDTLIISCLNDPIIKLRDCRKVLIEKITFECGRKNGVEINGGADNVVRCCCFRNFGKNAVDVVKSFKSGVENCEIYLLGAGGINIDSGDRKILKPGCCYARDNKIHDYALTFKIYKPAVSLRGVGNIAAGNKIYNAPHMGIFFDGNDNLIEKNEIYDVLKETSDAGAIYGGRDWTAQGNIIRFNYLHDFKGVGDNGLAGIYLDDGLSGEHVYKNIMVNMDMGILIGGGRDNIIEDNIIMNATPSATRSIWADSRGTEIEMFFDMFNTEANSELYDKLNAVPYRSKAWKKYRYLADIRNDDPAAPKHNILRNNVIINHRPPESNNGFFENSKVTGNIEINT